MSYTVMGKEIQTYKFYPKTWCQTGKWMLTNKPSQKKLGQDILETRQWLPSFQQVFILLSIYLNVTHQTYTMPHNNKLPVLHECDASRKVVMNTLITLQRWNIKNKWHHISCRTFQHSCLPIRPTQQTRHHATLFVWNTEGCLQSYWSLGPRQGQDWWTCSSTIMWCAGLWNCEVPLLPTDKKPYL